jgi:HEAT repeat protein
MASNTEQLPKLRAALRSHDRHRRAYAAIQLGQQGDEQSIDRLRDLTGDADDLVAIAAMFGCWHLGVDAVAIDRMVAALSSKDEELVQESVFALCEMGELMVPKLTGLLEQHPEFANSILRVLADIGGDVAFDTVTNFETDDAELINTIQELLEDWDDENGRKTNDQETGELDGRVD